MTLSIWCAPQVWGHLPLSWACQAHLHHWPLLHLKPWNVSGAGSQMKFTVKLRPSSPGSDFRIISGFAAALHISPEIWGIFSPCSNPPDCLLLSVLPLYQQETHSYEVLAMILVLCQAKTYLPTEFKNPCKWAEAWTLAAPGDCWEWAVHPNARCVPDSGWWKVRSPAPGKVQTKGWNNVCMNESENLHLY